MEEFEPKKKVKIFTKEFLAKNAYVLVLAVLLLGGITYGYTFFIHNEKIASGSITTAALTINFTDRSISASNLSVPTDDSEGMREYTKSVTITNQTSIDGRVKLTLTRTSGLNLTDMRYALVINNAVQEIDDVPSDGVILESAIMGNEVINVEVRLWPKSTYSGSTTTFVGELTPEIRYLGQVASSISSPAGKYVNFNCLGNNCEVWQIVKVEDGRLVLTTQANYEGATSRTNSNRYDPSSFNPAITFNDDSMITSLSTDGLNVYLAKTVKINGGSGTQADPYELINNDFREADRKVIAVITYKDGTNTVGTQNIYPNETTYITKSLSNPAFSGWMDGNTQYSVGDTVTFTTDKILTANTTVNAVNVSFNNTITGFNCTDTQCAIEKLALAVATKYATGVKCQRVTDATELHKEKCTNSSTSYYCRADGYALNADITYGRAKPIGDQSGLVAGDAFDCDVNGDGIVNVDANGNSIERFYYVSPYYNTNNQTFDDANGYATLIYYSNTYNGAISTGGSSYYASANENWHGPVTVATHLPTTTQWSNVTLKTTSRTILAEYESTHNSLTTYNGSKTIENPFSYSGKAARLLTVQELMRGCGLTQVGSYTNGELSGCIFLFEGTKYVDSSRETFGPWLETPNASNSSNVHFAAADVLVVANVVALSTNSGVRPAIDVAISDILY